MCRLRGNIICSSNGIVCLYTQNRRGLNYRWVGLKLYVGVAYTTSGWGFNISHLMYVGMRTLVTEQPHTSPSESDKHL